MTCYSREGLSMRPVEAGDLEDLRALRNDESTWAHLTVPHFLTAADQKNWLASLTGRSGAQPMVVEQNLSGLLGPFVGFIRMDERDVLHRSVRIGADVRPEMRRQGFGTRIYQMLLRYCFEELNCHRVWLMVLDMNKAGQQLYEKMGFKHEGTQREAVFRAGRYVDYHMMSILEGEWRAWRPR